MDQYNHEVLPSQARPLEAAAQGQLPALSHDGRGDAVVAPATPSLEDEKKGSFHEKPDSPADRHTVISTDGSDVLPPELVFDVRSGQPMPPNPDSPAAVNGEELTVRSIFVGCVLGALVGASNIYLGLKTGWTFGASLFGSIFGFGIVKAMSLTKLPLPKWFGGSTFTEQENVLIQAAASSAGGMGIIFIGGVPAIYQLGLMTTPKEDFTKWLAFTAVNAFFGMTFAIALRRWYILKLKLVFPSPTATALTIRALHSGKNGWEMGKKKIKGLGCSFGFSFCWKVLSTYAPGIMWDWHFGYWLRAWGYEAGQAMDNWWWYWEWTPAFIGVGMLTGPNGSYSFYGGSILAWAIMGPALVRTNQATGIVDEENPSVVNYGSLSVTGDIAKTNQVSPRYWLLFVGIAMMLFSTFVELFCTLAKMGWQMYQERKKGIADTKLIEDPMGPKDKISWKVWGPLTFIMIVFNCLAAARLFGMNVGLAILSVLLGFLWSFIAVQSSGVTDINPVSTTAKISQLVTGGATQGMGYSVNTQGYMPKAALINLYAGCIAGAAASQAADMTGDLRTAHLLRTRPKTMFIAQIFGAACSIFLVPGLFILFASAYPCILDAEATSCSFSGPSIAAWRVVGIVAASKSGLPVPSACAYTALAMGLFSSLIVVVRVFYIPPKYHQYVPNPVIAGLAFTLPQSCYSAAMAAGATGAYFWKKKKSANYDMYCFAVAAGFTAGEGLGGCLNALLAIVGADGAIHGTAAGCPDDVYCG